MPFERVLAAEYAAIHGAPPPVPDGTREDEAARVMARAAFEAGHTALCLSGGGIRSATFALGVIQGLAKLGQSAGDSVLAKLD